MHIVDFHNHIGVDLGAELSQSPDQLLQKMDEASIPQAVIFPFPGCPDLAEGNELVSTAAQDHPDRLIPFHCVNPREHRGWDRDDFVTLLTANGSRGVIVDTAMHHFSVHQPLIDPLVEACSSLSIPITVQFIGHGHDDCSGWVSLAKRNPTATFILSPLVYSPGWVALTADQPNILADTAKPMYPGHLDALVKTLGPERVLFGSETPYMAPILELEKFKYTDLSDDVLSLILSENAKRVLGKWGSLASEA